MTSTNGYRQQVRYGGSKRKRGAREVKVGDAEKGVKERELSGGKGGGAEKVLKGG